MKKNKLFIVFAAVALSVSSCKKDFLEEKRDLTGVNEEVFQDPVLAQAYVDYVYGLFQAPHNSQALAWELATGNYDFSRTTDEFGGETNWNKVWPSISYTNAHALGYFGTKISTSIGNNTWTRMRQINIFLQEVDKHDLADAVKNPLKGQLYFWRAWQYFDLVKLYGGVPLILAPQDPIAAEAGSLEVPRSSTAATFAQIEADLDMAMSLLPGKWDAANWGRITSGAAAALKGRALLFYASPQFNRNDDRARWQKAYDANLAAKTLLEANGFGLYKTGSLANATAWGNMWFQEANNPEAVFVHGFNNITSDQTQKWNGWEHAARPRTNLGGGSLAPTKQAMDAFPMKDGKMPGASKYTYSLDKFYKDRDPRFYKTFAYNGAIWPFQNNPNNKVWTYRWFASAAEANPSRTTETAGANSTGIYVNKATSPNASNANGNFSTSGTDYMEMRFAEVVLNLAEAAIGVDKIAEGIEGIRSIRERAGVENADGMFGLAGITGRDAAFAAVLKERQVEFAFEGKRWWDLRRWMLFTADYGTTARLGMQPLEGTRRTGLFIGVKKTDGTKYVGAANADPLVRPVNGGAPIINRDSSFATPAQYDAFVDYLYTNHFTVTEKNDVDPTVAGWAFKWYNEYYFFGLNQTVHSSSPYLEQTQGWLGINGMGTFNPVE